MIFKPNGTRLWDTFILPHDGKYYLFYLQYIQGTWDGYGLAVSDNLLNWKDFGTILAPGSGTATGMVFRTDDQWVLNYCKHDMEGRNKHVCFAVSQDLYHWEELSESYDLYPDGQWYDAADSKLSMLRSSRYGDMWVERLADGSYIGFLTASLLNGPVGANGVIGMATSADGLNWKSVAPASSPCGMGWAELGSHVEFNGRHYALVGSFNSGLGRRFDPVYNTSGKAGGMYVMMSEHIEGPYVLVDGDPLLLGCRNAPANFAYVPAYYSRTFLLDDEIMIHHHWMPRENFTDAWLGTCKVLREDRPGKLSIHWWSGNEALKGNTLFSIVDRPSFTLPESFDTPTGSWRYGDDGLELESESSVLAYCETQDLSMGVVVEADLRIDGNGAGGLFFGNRLLEEKHPFEGDAFLCNTRGYAEFGMITFGHCSPTFMPENNVLYTIPKGRTFHVRLLARGEFVEAYIDDRLVQCYGFSKPIYRNIGLFAENCRLTVKQLQVFEFSILASSPPRVDEA